jgi:hypothetical protein
MGNRPGDLARDEGFATSGPFMIEQDTVGSVHPIGLTMVHGNPISVRHVDDSADEGRPRQHAPDKCGIAPAARDPPSRDQLSAIRGHRTYVSLSE